MIQSYKIGSFCYQWSNNRINHNFFCDRNFNCRLDNNHFIQGNLYLRALTLKQFTELVTTSRLPSISDTQFLETYRISKYSGNNWWIARKIFALPMIIYDSIIALATSVILLTFPILLMANFFYSALIPCIVAFSIIFEVILRGLILIKDDPQSTFFTKIIIFMKKAPFLAARLISKLCDEFNKEYISISSLIDFWHFLMARLIIIFNDAKGIKNFHYIVLKKLFQAKGTQGRHLERDLILETYCKINQVNDENKIMLQAMLDNQMEKFRRKKLCTLEKATLRCNLKQFWDNQFNKNLLKWEEESQYENKKNYEGERNYSKGVIEQEALAVKHLLEPLFDLAKQFIHQEDQYTIFNSIAENLYKLMESYHGEKQIVCKQFFIRTKAQQILTGEVNKLNNSGYEGLWDDRVDLMLDGSGNIVRWYKLINFLLNAFNQMSGILPNDEDVVEQAPREIALVFFNSLKPHQKPALLNLLEKFPDLLRMIPNQAHQKIIGFNHKILVHLLPHHPEWLLKKSELLKIFKVFLLCNRSEKINKKPFLNTNMLWLVFSRIATMNYMGSNTRDLNRLTVQLLSAIHK